MKRAALVLFAVLASCVQAQAYVGVRLDVVGSLDRAVAPLAGLQLGGRLGDEVEAFWVLYSCSPTFYRSMCSALRV